MKTKINNMKRIIISAGPIPGRLDSVKYLTNRFKGGLTFKIADELSKSFDVTIIKWKYTSIPHSICEVVNIEDVNEYMEYMTTHKYDAYILGGAVANLIPVNPWEGKFPSHDYEVGEEFDITFTIAPRIIDEIKKKFPRSTLIGYKLFDGPENELIDAGWECLLGSKSNAIFCNHPATAKKMKIMVLPDGSTHRMTFDDHIKMIKNILNLEWYSTELAPGTLVDARDFTDNVNDLGDLLDLIKVKREPYEFGTVALRVSDKGFITTTRGKRDDTFCKVIKVDHENRKVLATQKATLNAPFLDKLFSAFYEKVIVHGHRQLPNAKTFQYAFDGTTQYEDRIKFIIQQSLKEFNIENHGYYKMFNSIKSAKAWALKN